MLTESKPKLELTRLARKLFAFSSSIFFLWGPYVYLVNGLLTYDHKLFITHWPSGLIWLWVYVSVYFQYAYRLMSARFLYLCIWVRLQIFTVCIINMIIYKDLQKVFHMQLLPGFWAHSIGSWSPCHVCCWHGTVNACLKVHKRFSDLCSRFWFPRFVVSLTLSSAGLVCKQKYLHTKYESVWEISNQIGCLQCKLTLLH